MNRKSLHERAKIIQCLTEGLSVHSTCRLLNVAKYTVLDLLVDVGRAAEAYQRINLRDLPCKRVQVDETWSFVYSKRKNTPEDAEGIGDVYTWTAICADTKIVPTWLVATREGKYANMFMLDLAKRLTGRIQLTTDGHRPYPEAVELAFGDNVDYARLIKNYNRKDDEPFIDKRTITGRPDPAHLTTNHVERQNLTMRMSNKRLTRQTNAFSKKWENHECMMAVYFMHYNFARIHQTLRVTPAMAAGVTDYVWSYEEIAELAEWNFKLS